MNFATQWTFPPVLLTPLLLTPLLTPEAPHHTQEAPTIIACVHPVFSPAAGGSRQAPAADVLLGLQQLLQRLQQGGYICGYQLVWGSLPGGWPGDWAVSEPQLVDAEDVLQQQAAIAPGSVFQVCADSTCGRQASSAFG